MSMSIKNNINSLIAQNNIAKNENPLARSISRLSSGNRLTQAADDDAGLAIAKKLEAQARALEMAQRNSYDAISLTSTADAGLEGISDSLVRMRELAVQSANGTLSNEERANLQSEFNSLQAGIGQIQESTNFNDQKIISSDSGSNVSIQAGADSSATSRIDVPVNGLSVEATQNSVGVNTASGALSAIDSIDRSLQAISSRRGQLGATQNRLYSAIDALSATHVNTAAAYSRINDADVAMESSNMTASLIRRDFSVSMLRNANNSSNLMRGLM